MRGVAGRPVEKNNQEQYLVGDSTKENAKYMKTRETIRVQTMPESPRLRPLKNLVKEQSALGPRPAVNTVGNGQAFHRNLAYPDRHLQDFSSDKIVFAVDQDLDQMINYRNNMPLARQGVADRGQYQPPPQ